MIVLRNVSLRPYNTFGLDYRAKQIIRIKSEKEAQHLFDGTINLKKPILIEGSGSNLLFRGDFKGTIILPEIKGIRVTEQKEGYSIISAGAGVDWDKLVEWCVEKDYAGLENLSLIPGTVGSVPVQNIGAYGQEAKNVIEKVKCISTSDGSVRYFSNEECRFGYRDSIFKKELKGKYLVVRVFFRLSSTSEVSLEYGSLKNEVSKFGAPSLKNIRKAVISIRKEKLPDPAEMGNAGSFFKNPVVSISAANKIKSKYPDMPSYAEGEGSVKLAAGWLIDKCGWKGSRIGDAGVHEKQALVLLNYGNASGSDLFDLSEKIRESVQSKFGISLEREVEIV